MLEGLTQKARLDPQSGGRITIGTVADFISEPWPASNQKPGRLYVGTTGRLASESAAPKPRSRVVPISDDLPA